MVKKCGFFFKFAARLPKPIEVKGLTILESQLIWVFRILFPPTTTKKDLDHSFPHPCCLPSPHMCEALLLGVLTV